MLTAINKRFLECVDSNAMEVHLSAVHEAEIDEMWSYVAKKKKPRWLWHAIDHVSGNVLAYVFGMDI